MKGGGSMKHALVLNKQFEGEWCLMCEGCPGKGCIMHFYGGSEVRRFKRILEHVEGDQSWH